MMKDPILPHSKQKYDWDCGIACSQMILSFMELYDANKLKRTMRDTLNLSTNIWTIDLAVILYLMGMDRQSMKFFSIYAGANPKHKEMSFYRNTSHEDDEIRINLLFHSLIHEKNSLLIEVKHLTIQDIIQEMKSSYRCVCIALIDATKMHCEWCTKGCTGLDSCIQLCNKSMGPCLHGLLGYCG
ncbi:hypothetical protein SNEBB_009254 [Seison nebaliae]|nr:hypothetical protein SNEBB_009254 [Seison nebaliae]